MKMQGAPTPRPMTHDLVTEMLGELNATVAKISVTELRDNTFFAIITLQVNGSEVEIDSRPSDALALAVRTDAPIFVSDQVIEDSAIEFGGEPEEQDEIVDEFRKFLEDVSPEDFSELAAAPPAHEVAGDHDALDLGRAVHHLQHLGERDQPRGSCSSSQP